MIEEEERVKLWFYMMRKREMFGDEAFWETWFGKGDWYKRLVQKDNGRKDNARKDNVRKDNRRKNNIRKDSMQVGQTEDKVESDRQDKRRMDEKKSINVCENIRDEITGQRNIKLVK